jgi:hypothetical protein
LLLLIYLRWIYTEAGEGKTIVDTDFSHIKANAKRAINAGYDTSDPSQLVGAFDYGGSVKGSRNNEVKINRENEGELKKGSLKGIKRASEIEIENESIRVWEQSLIGKGEVISKETLEGNWIKKQGPSKIDIIRKEKVEKKEKFKEVNPQPKNTRSKKAEQQTTPSNNPHLVCKECDRKFIKVKGLDSHHCLGRKIPFSWDIVRKEIVFNPLPSKTILQNDAVTTNNNSLKISMKKGFAVKPQKRYTHFNSKQKEYLTKLYNIGVEKRTERKSPSQVEKEMAKEFEKKFRLTEKQIKSYFSRLTAKRKAEQKEKHQSTSTNKSKTNKIKLNSNNENPTQTEIAIEQEIVDPEEIINEIPKPAINKITKEIIKPTKPASRITKPKNMKQKVEKKSSTRKNVILPYDPLYPKASKVFSKRNLKSPAPITYSF